MTPIRYVVALLCFFVAAAHAADPADYVKTLTIDPGLEVEAKYGTSKLPGDQGRITTGTLGLGYGATATWFTEAYVKYQKTTADKARLESTEWENKLLLSKGAVDLGLFVELEIPRARDEGYEFRFGPLLQAHLGRVQLNTNLFLKRTVRVDSQADKQETELHYQMQAKLPVDSHFDIGIQALGELGKWNHWARHDMQAHRIGPAAFGELPIGDDKIRFDVAWLVGIGKKSADSTLRLQMEYEF